MIKKIHLLLPLFFAFYTNAQVVVLSPPFATQNDIVTVTFDASLGNAELLGQSVVYAHTGVITNLSSTPTDWKHVQGNWGTDDAKVKMTNIGNNKFTLTYNIASFYSIPSNETVLKLSFVFRNVTGTLVGRNADASDIFVPISSGGFQLLFNVPSNRNNILNLNDSISIAAKTSAKANLNLYINDSLVTNLSNDSNINFKAIASVVKDYNVKLTATLNNVTYADSVQFTVRNIRVQNAPSGVVDGINYINDSTVILQLFAPYKTYVYAIGDFNNWKPSSAYDMIRTPDGNRYWIQLDHLTKGKEYRFQYLIDAVQIKVADPYADKLLDPSNDNSIPSVNYPNLIAYPFGQTSEYVSVFQTGQTPYNWKYTNGFVKPAKAKLNIYELLIRDFTSKHNYQALMDTLGYLQKLGINAIELMPPNEFEGNESWGYNTIFYFAPDKYYGTKDNLKAFIDECHRRGMAVIMDIVLNHSFGQSSMVRMYYDASTGKPAANSPWFNVDATHPYNVGMDFNHESIYTQALVDTVLKYWIREYKMDGYRFDMSKGFTQKNTGTDVGAWSAYDPSRVVILKRMYDAFTPTCSDCYLILEHFADNTEQTILSNYGFMFWGNMNYQFAEASMGYSSDLTGASYKTFGWSSHNLVTYMESHDEERIQYKNENFGYSTSSYDVKDTATGLSRNEAVAAIFLSIPGPKMIWQFGELGYDYPINYCPDGTVNNNCRLANKPIKWEYYNNPNRRRLYDVYSALNHLRATENIFTTKDFTHTLTGNYKSIRLNDPAYKLITIANTGVLNNTQKPGFQQTGWWYNYFSGDSIYVNTVDTTITLGAGEYRIYTTKKLATPSITHVGLPAINVESSEFVMYPNPAQQNVNLEFSEKIKGTKFIQITDISGRIVYTKQLTNHIGQVSINTETFEAGIYFVTLNNHLNSLTQKLIIQRN